MARVHTLTLELLRHGSATARPLSPATEYLALCGDHAPESVVLPEEHEGVLDRLRGLRYEAGEQARENQLRQTARLMTGMLGSIPGLLAELAAGRAAGAEMVHLRLVMAGAELALLPFELANAPPGAPDTGHPLLVQNGLPVCLTRQVRRVGQRQLRLPNPARVLFVSADPDDMGALPFVEHRRALRELMAPWIAPKEPVGRGSTRGGSNAGDEKGNRQSDGVESFEPVGPPRQGDQLVELRRATFADIERSCRRHAFTHVHVLAHGAPFERAGEPHFGIALHDPVDPSRSEVVDGHRLALALTARRGSPASARRDDDVRAPQVVTLASCDSGNPGSILDGGASVAHELHQAGIPWVVASQFPLSVDGSTDMVSALYGPMLWGEDPRDALVDLRRNLRLHQPRAHDWASVVTYASLPEDLDLQVAEHRVRRANSAAHNALDWADRLIRDISEDPHIEPDEWSEQLAEVLDRLAQAKAAIDRAAAENSAIHGLLATVEKRQAHVLHLAARMAELAGRDEARDAYQERSKRALLRSRQLYGRAFRDDLRANWAIAQYLGLGEVLDERDAQAAELWSMGRMAAENDLRRGRGRQLAWAHGTLLELYLLAPLLPAIKGKPRSHGSARQRVLNHARALADLRPLESLDVYTAHRQLLRYETWFPRLRPELETVRETVRAALRILTDPNPIHRHIEGTP